MVELEQTAMLLIVHSGNARAHAYEAFDLALSSDFATAKTKLQEATTELNLAHSTQTGLIQAEASGNGAPLSLLLVHAQDHLMSAMVELNLMERLIRMMEVRR